MGAFGNSLGLAGEAVDWAGPENGWVGRPRVGVRGEQDGLADRTASGKMGALHG